MHPNYKAPWVPRLRRERACVTSEAFTAYIEIKSVSIVIPVEVGMYNGGQVTTPRDQRYETGGCFAILSAPVQTKLCRFATHILQRILSMYWEGRFSIRCLEGAYIYVSGVC